MGNCREMSEVKFSEKQIVETSLHKTNYMSGLFFSHFNSTDLI